MLCLYILPLLIELNSHSFQLEANNKAQQLLYEELQAKLMDGNLYTNYSVFYQGIEYKILWSDLPEKEVCVKFDKNTFLQKTEICAVPE